MRSFAGRDILSLKDFERAEFERVFEVCDELAPIARSRQNADLLTDKTLLTAFYQPSTRTRLATEAAMHRLGGHVLGFSDAKMTRAGDFYQESIKDTVHMLEYYGDVIAMRHFQQGAPAEAAKWASVPVINCGDGWGEHPTQVLTDLYTTQKELGSIDGLTFLLVGDMRMRTMHSILYAMSQFDAKAYVVGPPEMSLLARVQGRARRAERPLRGGRLGRGRDRRLRRDLHGAGRPARLHEVARRARRRRRRRDDAEAYQVTRELLRDQAKTDVDRPAQPAAHGRAARGRRRHAARPLLVGGLQRRRHADGADRARARSHGVDQDASWSHAQRGGRLRREPREGDEPARAAARRLGLRSVKDGCAPEGSCGACTVIVDGRAVVSCAQQAARVEGKHVVTQEGLAEETRRLWAERFVAAGASQCGFCSPGIVMKAEALLHKNPEPTRDEIAHALLGNLCRCTGYVKIIDAIELAAAARRGEPLPEPDRSGRVGTRTARYRGHRARARRQARSSAT